MSHWERGVLLITWTVTVVMVVLVSVFDAGTWQAVVADGPPVPEAADDVPARIEADEALPDMLEQDCVG